MWFTGIIFEILFSFYTLNAFLVEKPHRHSVYAVFPYLYCQKSRDRNSFSFVISEGCYQEFYDNTSPFPRAGPGLQSASKSRIVVKMLSNRAKRYGAL